MARTNKRTATEPATSTQPSQKVSKTRQDAINTVKDLGDRVNLNRGEKTRLTNARNKLRRLEEAAAEAAVQVAVDESTAPVDQPSESLFGLDFTQSELKSMEENVNLPGAFEAFCNADVTKQPHTDGDVPGHFKIVLPQKGSSPPGSPIFTYANGVDDPRQTEGLADVLPTAMEVDTLDEPAAKEEPDAEAEALAAMEVDTPGKTDAAAELAAGEEALAAMEVGTPGKTDAAAELAAEEEPADPADPAAEKYLMILFSPYRSIEIRVHAMDLLVGLLANPISAYQNGGVMLSLLDFCKQLLEHAAQHPPLGDATFLDPRRLFGTNTMRLHEKVNTFLCHIIAPGARLENLEAEKWKRFMTVLAYHMTDNSFPILSDQSTAPQRQAHVVTPEQLAQQAVKGVMSDGIFAARMQRMINWISIVKEMADKEDADMLLVMAKGACRTANAAVTALSATLVSYADVFETRYDQTIQDLETLKQSRRQCIKTCTTTIVEFLTSELAYELSGDTECILRAEMKDIDLDAFADICTQQPTQDETAVTVHSVREASSNDTKQLNCCKTVGRALTLVTRKVIAECKERNWGIGPAVAATTLECLEESARPLHRATALKRKQLNLQRTERNGNKPVKKKKTNQSTKQARVNDTVQAEEPIGQVTDPATGKKRPLEADYAPGFKEGDDASR